MNRDIEVLVRKELLDLKSYEEPSLPAGVIRLHANENPYPFPETVREGIINQLRDLEISRYPDPAAKALRESISGYTGWPAAQTIVGNGSNELILTLMLTFGGPGARVVIPGPTFSMYKIVANLTGASVVPVSLNKDYEIDMYTLEREVKHPDTKLVMLCSPNNPTGKLIPLEQVAQICQSTQGLVVLDEAYYEFGQQTAVGILQDLPNLIILRTFSKAFGLAGQRVGYMLANDAVIAQVKKASLPYNLNAFTQSAAKVALEQSAEFAPQIEAILADRNRVDAALRNLPGLVVYPSSANFILFKCTQRPAGEVFHSLSEAGVIIRYFYEASGLENCLRVTIGTKEENDTFLEKLSQILTR